MATIIVYGPWNASIPGGLAPGQTSTSVWNIDPQPDYFTYQITAHSRQHGPATMLKVAETSLEWQRMGTDVDAYFLATFHVTLENVGNVTVNDCEIVISVVSEP